MSLHGDSERGNLTRENLLEYLEFEDVNSLDKNGYTPLALAIKGGHAGAVSLLLKNGADPNKKFPDGRTPLFAGVGAPDSEKRIVELLLEHGANANTPVKQLGNETPLSIAIRLGKPEIVRMLVDNGASPDAANAKGETPRDQADWLGNPAIQKAMRPKDEKPEWKPEMENFLVSGGMLALAYFGNWRDVGHNVIRRLGVLTKPPPPQDVKWPQTKNDFQNNLENFIERQKLEDYYPKGSPYIAKIARNAENLVNSEENELTPQEIDLVNRKALYQWVFYCDDSGSMKEDDRWPSQTEMVKRFAGLVKRTAPEDGVHLRFINSNVQENDVPPDQLPSKMNFTPDGWTPLGTNLKDKVLKPFIYDVLENGKLLKKPYFIVTITDGAPNQEPEGTFHKEITDSAAYVKSKGYSSNTLRYSLNQIGQDKDAVNFLKDWKDDPLVLNGTVFVTAEHLDSVLRKFRDDNKWLETWILRQFAPYDF